MKLLGFSKTANRFLSWAPHKAVRLVNALVRNAPRANQGDVVTMQTLEQIASGKLKVRQVGEIGTAQLRDLLEEFYEIEGGTGDGTEGACDDASSPREPEEIEAEREGLHQLLRQLVKVYSPKKDPRITEIATITRRLALLAPSSLDLLLDLLLAIARDIYEHSVLRGEGDRAVDVGKDL